MAKKQKSFYELEKAKAAKERAAFDRLVRNRKMENDLLLEATGNFTSRRKLVGFLYDLMRDHLSCGQVATLVADCQSQPTKYSNGFLARYAAHLAKRLM